MSEPPSFTRDDEHRLESLRHRLEGGEDLTDGEAAELERLVRIHNEFLDEGERRLREGCAPSEGNSDGWLTTISSAAKTVVGASYFWGSLTATALPGTVGRASGITPEFAHWSFVTSNIMLGAVPVLSSLASSGNHLTKIKGSLDRCGKTLGMVVACMTPEELDGYGLHVVRFAHEADWVAAFTPAPKYCMVPFVDGSADAGGDSHAAVHRILWDMEECVARDRAIYVHCKAGKGRSWLVVMCYLVVMLRLPYEEAEARVRRSRYQVSPSSAQREFVRDHLMWSDARDTPR